MLHKRDIATKEFRLTLTGHSRKSDYSQYKNYRCLGEFLKKRMCRITFKLQSTVAALILSAGVVGCAGSGGGSISSVQNEPQKMVSDLAVARWEALIKGDFAKAYSYLSPGTREVMSLDLYKAKIRGGTWEKANVNSVSCEHDQCEVKMAIEYSYRDMKSIETILKENWLRQNGKWWFVQRR